MKFTRWLRVTALVLVAIPVGLSAVIILLGVTVNLSPFKGKVEAAASSALGRTVTLEGRMELVPSLWPTVEIQGVRIANPSDWIKGDLLKAGLVRAQLGLVPLLEGKILIREITAEGVALMLETDPDGKQNWRFEALDSKSVGADTGVDSSAPPATPAPAENSSNDQLEFLGIDALSLRNIAVTHRQSGIERTFEFELEELAGEAQADHPMRFQAHGTLQNLPYTISFTGGPVVQLLATQELWPIDLSARGAGARLTVRGELSAGTGEAASTLEFQLSGQRIGDLAAWLGVSSLAKSAYRVSGQLALIPGGWRLKPLELELGRTRLEGELGQTGLDQTPLTIAKLQFDAIDPKELGAILGAGNGTNPEPSAAGEPKEKKAGLTLDAPILPTQVIIADADIDLGIKRIFLPTIDIRDVLLSSRFREGRVERSPFQALVAETLFKGDLDIDLRGAEPLLNFRLGTDRVDIGALLDRLHIADDLEMKADRLEVTATARGEHLQDLIEKLDFRASVDNGSWTLRDPNTRASADVQLTSGVVRAAPGQPITVSLDGRRDNTAVRIGIKSDSLGALLSGPDRLPLSFNVEGAGTQIRLSGATALPIARNLLGFNLLMKGQNLGSLDELLGVSLPPLGPYSIAGQFSMSASGYRVSGLELRVRDSDLTGNLSLQTKGTRPRIDVELTTSQLQINDFDVGEWSPLTAESESAGVTAARATAPGQTAAASVAGEPFRDLLSPEVLGSLDGRLSLNVGEVLSGGDKLGSGYMLLTLDNARFVIDPLRLNIPGGSFELALAYAPTGSDVTAEARAHIDRFDYGVLARSIDPRTEMAGLLSLDMNLKSRAENLGVIMHHVDGRLDFAVWPENFEAGVFDLWAVNLMTAVLPRLDSTKKSKINCAVGRFDLEDGRMHDDLIMVDTTNMRVEAEGRIDFKTERVKLNLKPRAKRPQFFSLATPIKVNGKFTDFKIGPKQGALVGTAIRFVTSPVHVPLRRVTQENLPMDGGAACSEAMKRASTQ